MDLKKVQDDELWNKIQVTFLEAMSIFVFTIIIGIFNAIDLVEFTRAELLFHLHSGTVGWISLSAVAMLVWFFTGDRDLEEGTINMAKNLLLYVQVVIPIYVLFFYLGFTLANGDDLFRLGSLGSGSSLWFILLVIGALFATLGFLWAFVFGTTELLKLETRTTPHYLFLGAMLTSTYGGIFGMILELQNLLETSFYDVAAGQDGTGAHAAAMEAGYLFMIIAAVLEWQSSGDDLSEVSLGGYAQTFCFFFAGLTIAFGAGFNLLILAQLNLPLLLIGVIIFIVRVLIKLDIRSLKSREADRFYIPSGFFMLFSVGFFMYTVSQIVSGTSIFDLFSSPFFVGLGLANVHGLFVGAMTSIIFATISVLLKDADDHNKRVEDVGYVLMLVGLIGFLFVLILRGALQENNNPNAENVRTDIAALMGLGLYLIMYSFFTRYRKLRA